ncbi:dolichol-phosphate mannose synthase [archaeon]|nr:dolichol-phosphate mannose synthase [archaeon]|tara:strand:+ start:446 stop:1111 length:666 start_codon:yes stop_codon:yes gene_type:complete
MAKPIALICAYNEEKHVQKTIDKTFCYVKNIVVVNDGSSDNTLNEIKKTKAILLNHKTNKGKGQAIKTGIKYCIKNKYDPIIFLDADGQHDPSEIPKFLKEIDSGIDIVIGTRQKRKSSMPLHRRMTNGISSRLLSLAAGTKIKDTQSGYRAIKKEVLENITLVSKRYDLESEILIKAAKNKYKIRQIPIRVIYDTETSTIHPIKDTFRFFRVLYRAVFEW